MASFESSSSFHSSDKNIHFFASHYPVQRPKTCRKITFNSCRPPILSETVCRERAEVKLARSLIRVPWNPLEFYFPTPRSDEPKISHSKSTLISASLRLWIFYPNLWARFRKISLLREYLNQNRPTWLNSHPESCLGAASLQQSPISEHSGVHCKESHFL